MTGRYGRLWLASLEEYMPAAFKALTPAERLEMARDVDFRARQSEGALLERMLKANPGPDDSLGKMAHVYQLQRSAQEIVQDGIVVKEPEDSPAETTG